MMRSPYLAGPVAFGSNFYGHGLLVAQLLDRRQTCIHLVGNRRSGKTSVLHRVEEQTGTVPLFVNLQRTGKRAVELGAALVRQIADAQPRFPVLEQVQREPLTDVCAIIDSLASVAAQHKLTILLLWDEGEKLLEMDPGDLECLRASLQDKPQLRIILAATQRLSRLMVIHAVNTSPFLHGFTTVYLPLLSTAEAIELISQSNNDEGPVSVTNALAAQIVDLTGGQPYLIQLLCRRLFKPDGSLRPIESDDLIVDEALGSVFQSDYDGFSSAERAILITLSKQPAGIDELARILGIHHLGLLNNQLHGLQQVGLISRTDGVYQIANFFLQNWLETGRMHDSLEGVSRHTLPEDKATLNRQIDEAHNNLRLIEERQAQYVLEVDVPLQLIKEERRLKDRIADLEQQLSME
jgi:hypothetical protein